MCRIVWDMPPLTARHGPIALERARSRLLLVMAAAILAALAALALPGLAGAAVPRLVGVRASGHQGFDRVVFKLKGGMPREVQVRYVPALIQDASGLTIPMPGRAVLRVRLSDVQAHDQQGRSTAPAGLHLALRNAMRIRRAGDFEATVSYGIGLAARRSFTLRRLHDPDRVVIDIDNLYRAVRKRVFFEYMPAFSRGRLPYVRAVSRWVPAQAPATGVMDRLFAGPIPAERSRELRLITSRATGFSHLSISRTVARIRLEGGCSSGGSTFTIADEIVPSLTQFSTVSYVKIYDPSGHTAQPGGLSSSIPECLNP